MSSGEFDIPKKFAQKFSLSMEEIEARELARLSAIGPEIFTFVCPLS